MNPWHRGFHWTPQTDKRWAAFLVERIDRVVGSPIKNFDTSCSVPLRDNENSDELLWDCWGPDYEETGMTPTEFARWIAEEA